MLIVPKLHPLTLWGYKPYVWQKEMVPCSVQHVMNGLIEFEYKEFEERKIRQDEACLKDVITYQTEDVTTEDGD